MLSFKIYLKALKTKILPVTYAWIYELFPSQSLIFDWDEMYWYKLMEFNFDITWEKREISADNEK